MAEKPLAITTGPSLFDDRKEKVQEIILPVITKSTKRRNNPVLPRLFRLFFALGIVYGLHAWISSYNSPWPPVSTWPVEVFVRPNRPILNGKAAEKVFL